MPTETYHGTEDIARAAGQTKRTIQLYLRERFGGARRWWRFNDEEFEEIKHDLANYYSQRKKGCRRRRRAKMVVTQMDLSL